MGRFFSNLQLHTAGRLDQEEVGAALREALAAEATAGGRELLVGPSGEWTAVYDGAIDGQGVEEVAPFASLTSRATGCPCVAVSVHDSDVLELALFEDGDEVDRLSTWPGYFEGADKPAPENRGGDPRRWRALLREAGAEQELERAWRLRADFEEPERILEAMAAALGWDPAQATTGYRSLPAELRERSLAVGAPAAASAAPRAAGPPAFGVVGGSEAGLSVAGGSHLETTVVAHNAGGPMRGISVAVEGAGVALLADARVSIAVGPPGAASSEPVTLEPREESPSPTVLVAAFDELAVPSGYPDMAAALAAAGGDYRRGMDAWLACRVEVSFEARAERPGASELVISLLPAENPAGSASWSLDLEVRSS
jgi:hypothetical protein